MISMYNEILQFYSYYYVYRCFTRNHYQIFVYSGEVHTDAQCGLVYPLT